MAELRVVPTGQLPEESEEIVLSDTVRAVLNFVQESRSIKFEREFQNRRNWDIFNLRQDWSHKQNGQSRVFLPHLRMAALQMRSFVKKSLSDIGNSVQVELDEIEDSPITDKDIKSLLTSIMKQNNFPKLMGDSIFMAAMEGRMTVKVRGEFDKTIKFVAEEVEFEEDSEGQPSAVRSLRKDTIPSYKIHYDVIPLERYHPDAEGRGMYDVVETEVDLHQLAMLANDPRSGIDKEQLELLRDSFQETENEPERRSRENTVEPTKQSGRKKVKLQELYGIVPDPFGLPIEFQEKPKSPGEEGRKFTKVYAVVANERFELIPPQPVPNWIEQTPIFTAGMIEIPNAKHFPAIMDAVAALNKDENELFSMMVDGAMGAAHGILQIHKECIENQKDLEDGIGYGGRIIVNENCPPGTRAIEQVATGRVPQDGVVMMGLLERKRQEASLTNETQLGGFAGKNVKATEVVQAAGSIASTFEGITVDIEGSFVEPLLLHTVFMALQHKDDMSDDDLIELFGPTRADEIKAIDAVELFAAVVSRVRLNVKGLTAILEGLANFRKLIQLLQVVGANPVLAQEFNNTVDAGELFKDMLRMLSIDTKSFERKEKVETTAEERAELLGANRGREPGVQQGPSNNLPTEGFAVGSQSGASPENQIPLGI